jgi:hypothetical protein
MGRIMIQDQPRQSKFMRPHLNKNKTKPGVVVCACHPVYSGMPKIGLSGPAWGKKQDPHLQNNYSKKELLAWFKW